MTDCLTILVQFFILVIIVYKTTDTFNHKSLKILTTMNLNRQLDPREKRRLKIHYMLPIDVVDPSCRTSELLNNNVQTLYYYGSGLDKMFLDLDNFENKHNNKFISNIRGIFCPIICSFAFICYSFYFHNLEQVKYMKQETFSLRSDPMYFTFEASSLSRVLEYEVSFINNTQSINLFIFEMLFPTEINKQRLSTIDSSKSNSQSIIGL